MEFPHQYGPWQILARHNAYRDPWIDLTRDDVIRPDGARGTHCIVRLKAGITVLAIDENDLVYLAEEFHYAVGRKTLEAVSGGIEHGESAAETARRELREELGILANSWTDFGTCDPFTSIVVSPTRLFLAEQLTFGPTTPEGTEQIHCRKLPLEEAVHMVLDGRISHAPSALLILKVKVQRGGL